MPVLTALELLQEIDDPGTFSGPWNYGDDEDEELEHRIRALLGSPESQERPPPKAPKALSAPPPTAPEAPTNKPSTVPHRWNILPKGDRGDGRKFIACFPVGLEDDTEFCLVKRLLGKGGNNMKSIADECNAKLRVRGIGSGYLEGSDHMEADIPLQIHVSCESFDEYVRAIWQTGQLLRDLYKHHRRYRRSSGLDPIPVELQLKELRRDDHGINLLNSENSKWTATPPAKKRSAKAKGVGLVARSPPKVQPKMPEPRQTLASHVGQKGDISQDRLPGPGTWKPVGKSRAQGRPSAPAPQAGVLTKSAQPGQPPPCGGSSLALLADGDGETAHPVPSRKQGSREAANSERSHKTSKGGSACSVRQCAIGAAATGKKASGIAAYRSPKKGAVGSSSTWSASTVSASSLNQVSGR